MPAPVFFAVTRSFWLGVVPSLLAFADILASASQPETAGPIADVVAWASGCDPETAATLLRGAGALGALVVAQQRRGVNRPYTARIGRETLR